jgi:hypothetical protein
MFMRAHNLVQSTLVPCYNWTTNRSGLDLYLDENNFFWKIYMIYKALIIRFNHVLLSQFMCFESKYTGEPMHMNTIPELSERSWSYIRKEGYEKKK